MKKIFLSLFISFSLALPAYSQKEIVIIPFDSSNELKNLSYALTDNISESLTLTEDVYVIDRGQLMSALREKNISIDLTKLNYVSSFFDTDLTIKGKLINLKNNSINNNENYNLELNILDSKNGQVIKKINVKANNIFTLQNKAIKEIIKEQNILVTENQLRAINTINYSTANIQAYLYYLASKSNSNIMTESSIGQAIDFLDKALKNDPKFILAKAEKAELTSIVLLYSKFQENIKQNEINKLDKYIESNLKNTDLPQVYKAKSLIYYLKGDNKNSLQEAKKAYELSPNDTYTNYLIWINQSNKDESLMENSLRTNSYFIPFLISKAIEEKNKAKYDQALEIYERINKFTPKQNMINSFIGDIYLEQEKRNQAVKIFEEILTKEPQNYKANIGLGRVYQERDQNDKALEFYNKAIIINPLNSYPHFLNALVKHSEGKVDEAILEYNNAISLEPLNSRYYSGLGQLYYQLGKYQEAETQYKKSIELNPDLAYAYVNLGLVYGKQKKYDDAIEQIKQALNIKPDYSYAYYNMGLIYQEKGDIEPAKDSYKKSLIIDENNALTYNKLGEIYQLSNDNNSAINNYIKAIELEPRFIAAYINLGKLQLSQGKFKDSISTFKTALKLNKYNKNLRSESSKAYLDYGVNLYNNNDFKSAIKNLKESISIKPDNELPYLYLGMSYYKLSMYKESVNEFKKAIFINNSNQETFYNLALSYEKLKMKKEANQSYQKACELGKTEACNK